MHDPKIKLASTACFTANAGPSASRTVEKPRSNVRSASALAARGTKAMSDREHRLTGH
jgi:hypothetical protein